jgi:hypothetical protein
MILIPLIPEEDAIIRTYGQEAEVLRVEKIPKSHLYRVYLFNPIVVPGREYTRDWVTSDEIQEYNGRPVINGELRE